MASIKNNELEQLTNEQAQAIVNEHIDTLELRILNAHNRSTILGSDPKYTVTESIKSTLLFLGKMALATVVTSVALFGAAAIILVAPKMVPAIAGFISASQQTVTNSLLFTSMIPGLLLGTKFLYDGVADLGYLISGTFKERDLRKKFRKSRQELVLELDKIKNMDTMQAANYISNLDEDKSTELLYPVAKSDKALEIIKAITYKEEIKKEKALAKANAKTEEKRNKVRKFKEEYEELVNKNRVKNQEPVVEETYTGSNDNIKEVEEINKDNTANNNEDDKKIDNLFTRARDYFNEDNNQEEEKENNNEENNINNKSRSK